MSLLNQIEKLNCNGCIFFKENKCTSANSKQNEEEKFKVQEILIATQNINDTFICMDYISKNDEK